MGEPSQDANNISTLAERPWIRLTFIIYFEVVKYNVRELTVWGKKDGAES